MCNKLGTGKNNYIIVIICVIYKTQEKTDDTRGKKRRRKNGKNLSVSVMNKVCGVLHSRVSTDSGNRHCYEKSRRRDFGNLHQKRKRG